MAGLTKFVNLINDISGLVMLKKRADVRLQQYFSKNNHVLRGRYNVVIQRRYCQNKLG